MIPLLLRISTNNTVTHQKRKKINTKKVKYEKIILLLLRILTSNTVTHQKKKKN